MRDAAEHERGQPMARGDGRPGDPVRAHEPIRLSRNRAYTILWTSLLLSELASETAFIAFPLLILASSGTAVQVGLVTSVLAAARTVANVPAGALADRVDRKKLMLLAQAVRTVAMASTVPPLLHGGCSMGQLVLVAVLEGAFSAVFQPAEHAALPQVVAASQLSDAVARNSARPFAALLAGPALAGVTFGVHRVVPFGIIAAVLAVSFAALTRLRLPPRPEPSSVDTVGQPAGSGLLQGFRLLLRHPPIRATVVWMVAVNLAFHALVIVILVASGENDVEPGEIGFMMAFFGAGGVLGALVAARLHAALPPSTLLAGSSWLFAGTATLLALASHGLLAGALLGVAALAMPVANTTVLTYQLTITRDELRGRLSGVVGLCADLTTAVGPILGGALLLGTGSATTGVLVCAALLVVVAIGSHLSPTLRRFPSPATT